MADRTFLHIGAPKSGTTYLQSLLWSNRELLRERRLLFPGGRPFDQNRASIEVRAGKHLNPRHDGVWTRFVQRSEDFAGDLVLSNEWYVLASPPQIEKAVADLSEHTEVHLVLTARDLVAQIPAGWQETLKIGAGLSLDAFVDRLDDRSQQWSWGALDAADALEPWAAHVPAGRIHVVTVPRSSADPTLLWRRFLGVLGADPAGTDTESAQANESLGVESARLLQEFGPSLLAALDAEHARWQVPYEWLRNFISHEVLVPLGGTRIGIGDELAERLRERSRTMVERLGSAGYDLVGDPAELLDGRPRPDGLHPDDVPPEAVLDRARVVTAALLRELRLREAKAEA